MTISVARKAAYTNLLRIHRDGSYSSELLAGGPEEISERDANLIHTLTLGVIRKQILLDFVIDLYSKIKSVKLDPEVLIILRLGLFQLLFLDKIPGYSAVNESVELTRFAKKKSASGLVNAVLRKAATGDRRLPEMSGIERLSLETSHPLWLLEKWSNDFGIEKTIEIAHANNSEPGPAFRFTSRFDGLEENKKAEITREIESLSGIESSTVAAGAFTAHRIDGKLKRLSQNGYIYFQDQGSQLIGELVVEKAGRNILDLCAAPGSKSTQIARSLKAGQLLISLEIRFRRAQLLRRNALLQNISPWVVCADGTADLPFAAEVFDTVLVDAPCTGTGTIRRNPEIRYKPVHAVIDELKSKQLRLLRNASKVLKSNGSIVYSTCSLEREENEDVVSEFLKNSRRFRIEPLDLNAATSSKEGFARILPGEKGSDGFFIAFLRRV